MLNFADIHVTNTFSVRNGYYTVCGSYVTTIRSSSKETEQTGPRQPRPIYSGICVGHRH